MDVKAKAKEEEKHNEINLLDFGSEPVAAKQDDSNNLLNLMGGMGDSSQTNT
jgi:hypothetical protein